MACTQVSANDISGVTDMAPSTYCIVYAQSDGKSGVYTRAFAVIGAEHPDLLRLSCYHEEIAQALGLPNDSPRARPSIFNDDEEFALLTRQDEAVLRMLYNPAFRPGMSLPEGATHRGITGNPPAGWSELMLMAGTGQKE